MNSQYSTGHREHVEIPRPKQCYIVYDTSVIEDHVAALIGFINRNATFLKQQRFYILLKLVQVLKIDILMHRELQALVKL